jgi:GT2 family glycosyltransferase
MDQPETSGAREVVVSALILAHNRAVALGRVLDRLAELPVDEILVVDNGSEDGTAEVAAARGGKVRLVDPGGNVGIDGRNVGAQQALGEFLLMLDDDSYPVPGAIEALLEAFRSQPRLGVAGGLVTDVDLEGRTLREREVGTFDWFLRHGHRGGIGPEGIPTFFFPEGASMARREAYLDAGGFFAPYFFTITEVDLSTRMLGRGWDVRYVPTARFEHMKEPRARTGPTRMLRYAVRNQIWYFWLRFPLGVAARRIPAYLAFDLVLCARHGAARSWAGGIADAWRDRDAVRGRRSPLPRAIVRRAEINRGRMHLRLLWEQLLRRLPGLSSPRPSV